MSEPFEYVSTGMDLVSEGRYDEAKRYIQRGIREYEKHKDNDGLAFALGRLADCCEQAGETDKAKAAYERAIEIGTDIPAIYRGLIGILVSESDLDQAFHIADLWESRGGPLHDDTAYLIFTDLASNLTRQERFQDAQQLLRRAIDVLPRQRYPTYYWSARGQLGQVFEKSGDLGSAMDHYREAIAEGSTDRNTYTRYLINLEKLKRYDDALLVVAEGLAIQKDASWEADLRKRQQRLMQKSGATPKGTPKAVIPDFAIRKGERSISLIQQVQYSPQLRCMTRVGSRIYGTTGGKSPKLIAHDLGDDAHAWQVGLPFEIDTVLATQERIILFGRDGAVGSGQTHILFCDTSGTLVARQRLPDVPSEAVLCGEILCAGCRDGKLYAFSAEGMPLWRYAVPGSTSEPESPYLRPCPYYVSAAGDVVAFSSFADLFVLNTSGTLMYQWRAPEHASTTETGSFRLTISTGPGTIRALCVSHAGKQVLVALDNAVVCLEQGHVSWQVGLEASIVNSMAAAPTGNVWAISTANKVFRFEGSRRAGSFPLHGGGPIRLNPVADRIIGWAGRNLAVATYSGTLLAEVEFARNVQFADCLDDGKMVVGTRYAILLDTVTPPTAVQEEVSVGPESAAPRAPIQRHREEEGIPIHWLDAEKISVGPGKSTYRGLRGEECTIEQIALEHYQSRGCQGAWTENTYWWEVMALLFWDVIFARVPGTFTPQLGEFPSRGQDMPQDFFTPHFYARRKGLIAKRIRDLTATKLFGLRKISLAEELVGAYRRNFGKPCRPIENWERYSLETLEISVKSLTRDQLMLIMTRLLENFNENRRGLPDLFFTDSSGRPRFVEVKAEKEKVAPHQIAWLQFLQSPVGIPVEICRVVS